MKLPPIKHEDLTVSAHGFSLFLAFFVRSTIVAIGWLVVFLVALCVFLWQSYGLFHAYRSYASQFDIHIRYGNVPFPAVSICNLNTFKKSHLGEYPELFALVDAFTGGGGTTSTSVTTTASPPSGRRKRAALPPFPMSGPSPDLYCYFFETFDKKNYANHVAGCQAYGAELPEVPSMDEVNYVNALVDKKTTIKTVGGFYFLGYDDYVTYKTFATKSGTTLATTNYMSGQPNHLSGKQHCIHAVSDKSYQWNDLKCEDTGFGVCQLKVTCTQPSILNGQAVMAENQQQATVSCDVGYYLEGDPQLTCGCDGTWVRLPVCSPALVFGPTSLGKCYHVSTPQPLRTWTDAKDFCSSSPNRALPDFHRNLAGSDDVTSELTEMADVFAAADGALTTATSFAVGYTRTGTTGAFTSVNAYTLGASAGVWDTGNPSAVANTCTYVAKDNGYATLRSQDCGTLSDLNTVCEIPGVGCDVDPAKYSKATYAAGEALSCLNGFSLTNAPTCNCDGTWSGASADLCSDAEFGPGPSGMCYRVAGRGNFDASVALCTALGLDLFELPASIADADHLAEYNFVSSTAASYTPVINDYYTGYRRNNALPGWQYVRSTDNSLMTWMNWNTNPVEPNGGDPCVHCYSGWGYRFNDAPCGAEKYTICSHRVFCEATVADSDWSTGGSTFAGQPASMVCSDSYVLTGNVPICGCDGQWSGALPTCVWCASCPMTVPNSDAAAGISLLSGQKAAITCDAGYITGDDMPTCTCGTLDRTVPVCSVALPKPIIENACTPISCTGALQCNNSVGCCTYGGTEHCLCEIGFTSPDCGQNIDDCWSAPCENGGMCVDGIDTYSCDCAAGYTGKNCEIDIDECASNPCDDGTKCLQGVGTFSCLNMTEYVGLVDAAYAYEPTIGPDGVVVPENDQSLQMRAQDKIAYVVRSLGLDMAGNVSDFLKDCWQGSMTGCEKLFLNQTFDPDLGTCFVYNFNPNDRIHTSNNWADDELHLHMYVQQSEYLPITDSAGVRLLVHSPNTPAFPDAQSFRIAPGYINFLNLVYESSSQLPAPYSDCVDKGHPDPYFYDGAYVVGGCERSRMQQSVVDACDCGDPRLPLPNNASYCDISKVACVSSAAASHSKKVANETACRTPCNDESWYASNTQIEWPQDRYAFVSLLSHFGGWMGVMLGMSLISVLEFIVFGQWIVGLVRDPAVSKKSLTARREHVPKKKSIAAPKKNLKT